METVLAAVISGAVTLAVCLVQNHAQAEKTRALLDYRLRELENFTAKDICDLAREGEEMAGRIVDRCGEYLGRAMSFVSCTTDPDVFVVGGGMSRAGAVVTNAALKYFRKYAFHVSAGTFIVIAELGNDAGIYGCAKMVLHD